MADFEEYPLLGIHDSGLKWPDTKKACVEFLCVSYYATAAHVARTIDE
jgi:hypothetical protein